MLRNKLLLVLFVITVFSFGFVTGRSSHPHAIAAATAVARPESEGKVFELRTYTTNEGKLDALQARFRDHTIKLFKKHGITSIGYWVPQDTPLAQNTLIYILAHPSREAAKKNWAEFVGDPEWQKVKAESEAPGKIVSKIDSVYMTATDYSSLK
jgi:NIPSNAP